MFTSIPTFNVVTYSVIAPKTGGGKFRRPVDVCVIRGERRSRRNLCRTCKTVARNVDSRYDGQRSAHGQALEAAYAIANERNEALFAALDSAAL